MSASNNISVQIPKLSTEFSGSFEAVSRVFRHEALDTILFSLFHSARANSAGLGASIDQLWSADRRTCSSIHAVASNSSFSWNSFSITQWAFRKYKMTIVITAVLYRPGTLRRRCGTISVIKINSARGAGSGSTWLRLKWYVR